MANTHTECTIADCTIEIEKDSTFQEFLHDIHYMNQKNISGLGLHFLVSFL